MTDQHTAREVAQLAMHYETVAAADAVGDPDGHAVEIVVDDHRIRRPILSLLAGWDLALDPDATATRGDPTHTVVVAR